MGFRFSIRWALAAVAYVALAAAALTQEGWAYAWLLWLASFAAFVYAVLLACYARGRRQARSLGFAVGSLSLAACLYLTPANVATEQLLRSLGIIRDQILFAPTTPTPVLPPQAASAPVYNSYSITPGATGTLSVITRSAPPAVVMTPMGEIEPKVRGANAVATVLSGMLGLLLGSLAFTKGHLQPEAS
jgi:hypothetical protein